MFIRYTSLFFTSFVFIIGICTQEIFAQLSMPTPSEIRTELKNGSWQTKGFDKIISNESTHISFFIYDQKENQFYIYNEQHKNEFKNHNDFLLVMYHKNEICEVAPISKIETYELALLITSVIKEDLEALHELSLRYALGWFGVTKNKKVAFDLSLMAAEKGYADAQFTIGKFYENAVGIEKDIDKALFWYTKAAMDGKNGEAAYRVGEYEFEREKYDAAFSWFSTAGSCSYVPGLIKIGDCYEKGVGIKKDLKKAFDSYYLAATSFNNADGLFNLGRCYLNGIGTETNYKLALEYLNKALEKNNPESAHHIGIMYVEGLGIEKNEKEAVKWFTKSAELEDDGGQFQLAECYRLGVGIEKDLTRAVELYKKSADQGNVDAINALGFCYEHGEGIEKNMCEAVKYYQIAAENNNSDSQYQLGICYAKGIEVKQDFKEAFKWFKQSASNGDIDGNLALGDCYKFGEGIDIDLGLAFNHYLIAAEQGNAVAQYNVACMYESGIGIDENREVAKKWHIKAAWQGNLDAKNALEELLEEEENFTN